MAHHPHCNACRSDLRYRTRRLYCCGTKGCEIQKTDGHYYEYSDGVYMCCRKCYEAQGDTLSVQEIGDDFQTITFLKKDFSLKEYREHEYEATVACINCHLSYHRICVGYFETALTQAFICEGCLPPDSFPNHNPYPARILPPNNLSQFIEYRVNRYLSRAGTSKRVLIRVLSSSDHTFNIKERFGSLMKSDPNFPTQFPYRTKAIFAFQEVDNQDIFFYGMHCQEYGSQCPQPNTKRLYITYLDSINLFSPKDHRTRVYQIIILSYLEHARIRGFQYAHIWSCPPSQGDDYIFYAHPKNQKFPKQQRLIDWYKKLFDRGIQDNIIETYSDIQLYLDDQGFLESGDFLKLPYFDGDFWPKTIEEAIEEIRVRKEAANKQPDEVKQPGPASKMGKPQSRKVTEDQQEQQPKSGSTKKSKKKNKAKRAKTTPAKVKLIEDRVELMRILTQRIKDNAGNFFVLTLTKRARTEVLLELSNNDEDLIDKTLDLDVEFTSQFFNGRVELLIECRKNFLEFSSLRSAKYSTAVIIYKLHEQLATKALEISTDIVTHLKQINNGNLTCSKRHCKYCWASKFDNEGNNKLLNYLGFLQGVNPITISYTTHLTSVGIYFLYYHSYICQGETCKSGACHAIRSSSSPQDQYNFLFNSSPPLE